MGSEMRKSAYLLQRCRQQSVKVAAHITEPGKRRGEILWIGDSLTDSGPGTDWTRAGSRFGGLPSLGKVFLRSPLRPPEIWSQDH